MRYIDLITLEAAVLVHDFPFVCSLDVMWYYNNAVPVYLGPREMVGNTV